MIKVQPWAIYLAVAILGAGIGIYGRSTTEVGDEIVFISVGQGDCTLVESEGHSLLIDVGPKTDNSDSGSRIILPDLKKWGVKSIDWILLSHPDRDHVGGLQSIHRAFPTSTIIMPQSFKNDPKMDQELVSANVKVSEVDWVTSMSGHLGRFKIDVRCPPWDPQTDDNLGCMLVHVADGGASLTTSGDAPMAVERAMIPVFNWKAQILHLGHHGSKFSTSEEWLAAVSPQIAVASCGYHNEYGHPHKEVVRKVKAAGIQLRRTDLDGDLFYRDINQHFVRESGF